MELSTRPTSRSTTSTIDESANLTVASKYVRDFESLFVHKNKARLRDKARNGQLRHCQFRSLCWRYFLRCLPEDYEKWVDSCKISRKRYEEIKAKHLARKSLVGSRQMQSGTPANIPAEESDSDKHNNEFGYDQERPQLVEDNSYVDCNNREMKQVKGKTDDDQQYNNASAECDHKNVSRIIKRDVVRTFPEMEFFRRTEVQVTLENVLFNFASENPLLSYKQGMHELVATLLYVLHTDSQSCIFNHEGGQANGTIATLLDHEYLEHDVFHLFSALMNCIESWYQNDEIVSDHRVSIHSRPSTFANKSSPKQQSVLSLKLKTSGNILRHFDKELYNHLEALQIAPQIYGIRWMRLLFGREFEFIDLLTIWDAIICDEVPMSLNDYIFASMLIAIRENLVNGDYTDCLNNLMRHQFKDVQYVIKLALHLREPQNYIRPKPMLQITQLDFPTQPKLNQLLKSIKKHTSRDRPVKPSSEDLHPIVEYCWQLLSEQIDSLQRCLPREKGLDSEDEIFVALAQLKKIRDVLKGSLRLEVATTGGDKASLPSR